MMIDENIARQLLYEAEKMNPGLWIDHSKVVASCSRAIAEKCKNLDSNKAYVFGLLHDIGRREGVTDMRHIIDGYKFMMKYDYDECARICLTHSFPYKDIRAYNGVNDCDEIETGFIEKYLSDIQYDDYDRLIQLCDALAMPSGATYIEKRLVDVVLRRGFNELTINKWKAFLELKDYFDRKTGTDVYKLVEVSYDSSVL